VEAPVTNIRNTSSPHWRGWLKPENRCFGPGQQLRRVRAGAEPETKKKDVVWFALNEDRTGRYSPSLASGRRSTVIAAPSRSRYLGHIKSMAS
jgi:hypothetical protein